MASWSLFSKFVFCSILMTWNFTVDGSTKMPNGHMDAIEPYDYRAFQPFSTTYLPGYMADKYDEDADTCQARAHSRMQNSVSSELSASITPSRTTARAARAARVPTATVLAAARAENFKSIHFDTSGGFLCESRRWPFIGIFRYGFGKCSAV